MSDRELLNGFFAWLVDQGIAPEGYVPNSLTTQYLMAVAARNIQSNIDAHETEDERIKRETMNEAHREAERDLEKVARANSGFQGARQ